MLNCRRCRLCVYVSMLTCLIGSASVFFVTKVSEIADKDNNNTPMYIVGAVFWLSFILTYVLTGIASYNRKQAVEMGYGEENQKRIGIISFFGNIEAKIADIVMACSIIFVIYEIVSGFDKDMIILVSIFLSIFSIHMHGILNGKNYQYAKLNKDI